MWQLSPSILAPKPEKDACSARRMACLIDGLSMCAQGATIRSFAGVHALRDGIPDLPRMLRLDGRCRSRYIAGEDIIYAFYYALT